MTTITKDAAVTIAYKMTDPQTGKPLDAGTTAYLHGHDNLFDKVEAALERDNFMSAEDAKEWGLIDEILESRPKADDTAK